MPGKMIWIDKHVIHMGWIPTRDDVYSPWSATWVASKNDTILKLNTEHCRSLSWQCMENWHFQKQSVTWYKNIGPSDASFFMRRCGRRAQGQPHWNKLRCRVLWPRIGKGRSVKGEGHFDVFFFGHLFMFICWSSMHRNEHFHVGCWVVWLVHTWPYLYHFVLFQMSIHTKLGVDSGFWLWKPWISNFACFPFRLPCVWCRSQKTCWHCRTRNFWDIKPY